MFSIISKCFFLHGTEQTGTLVSLQKKGAGYLHNIHHPNFPEITPLSSIFTSI